jgi:hypothetical protein
MFNLNTLQAKIALALVGAMIGYLKDHPEVLDKLLGQVAELVPGKWDDAALTALAKLLRHLGI